MNRRGAQQGSDALYLIVYILIAFGISVAVFVFPQRLLSSAVQPVDFDAQLMAKRIGYQVRELDPFVGWQQGVVSQRPLVEVLGSMRPSQKRYGLRVARGSDVWYPGTQSQQLYDAAVRIQPEGIKLREDKLMVGQQSVVIGQALPEWYESFG